MRWPSRKPSASQLVPLVRREAIERLAGDRVDACREGDIAVPEPCGVRWLMRESTNVPFPPAKAALSVIVVSVTEAISAS